MQVVSLLDSRLSKVDFYYKSALRDFCEKSCPACFALAGLADSVALAMHFPNACIWEVEKCKLVWSNMHLAARDTTNRIHDIQVIKIEVASV